jgi:hypothetical protein
MWCSLIAFFQATTKDFGSKPKILEAPVDRARLEAWMAAARASNPASIEASGMTKGHECTVFTRNFSPTY